MGKEERKRQYLYLTGIGYQVLINPNSQPSPLLEGNMGGKLIFRTACRLFRLYDAQS